MGSDWKDVMKTGARWCGFIGSFLTLVLGIIHLFNSRATLLWPDNFIADVNQKNWRTPLFTFAPERFGAVGSLCHFQQFHFESITQNFLRFFIFHLIMAFFATVGYEGGLGILFSIPVWLCCLLSLIGAFIDDDNASLELNIKIRN